MRRVADGDDQIALPDTCAERRRVGLHAANEQTVTLGQPDGATQPLRATRGGAIATPSVRSLRRSAATSLSMRSRVPASVAVARTKPPSRRITLKPSSPPSAATSGPPDAPRGHRAVCATPRSRADTIRRDEAERGREATTPRVRERDHGRADRRTLGAERERRRSAVSTESAAKPRRRSSPVTVALEERPSAKTTSGAAPVRFPALVDHPAGRDDRPAPARASSQPDHARAGLPAARRMRSSSVTYSLVTLHSLVTRNGSTPPRYDQRMSPNTPLAQALARVGDRWTLQIVAELLEGPARFGGAGRAHRRNRTEHADAAATAPGGGSSAHHHPLQRAAPASRLRAHRRRARPCHRAPHARSVGGAAIRRERLRRLRLPSVWIARQNQAGAIHEPDVHL